MSESTVTISQGVPFKIISRLLWYEHTVSLRSRPCSFLRRTNVKQQCMSNNRLIHQGDRLSQEDFRLNSSPCKAFPGSYLSTPRSHPESNPLQISEVNLCRRGRTQHYGIIKAMVFGYNIQEFWSRFITKASNWQHCLWDTIVCLQ